MCQKRSSVNCLIIHNQSLKKIRADPCIRQLIQSLNNHGYNTVAACCGHNRYPLTIICKTETNKYYDLISGIDIPRTRKYYKKDAAGFFYVPEIVDKTEKQADIWALDENGFCIGLSKIEKDEWRSRVGKSSNDGKTVA